MSAIVEKHYAPWELVVLLGFTERHWIEQAKGLGATKIFDEWRIPASAVNRLIDAGKVKPVDVDELGIAGRTEGEVRRKVGLRRGRAVAGGVE